MIPLHAIQSPHDSSRMIAEATAPHLAGALYKAFLGLRAGVTDRMVYAGMANGNLGALLRPELTKFDAMLRSATLLLGNAHAQSMNLLGNSLGRIRKTSMVFDLDALPQPTQDAMDGYDFGLVREVSDDTLATISQVINRGIAEGWAPAKMARQLQGGIGLTATQEAALNNYRSLLENGRPEALTRALRDERSDETVQAHIDGLRPLSPQQIDRLVARYEDRYLSYRANTIARYESLRASNQGASDAVQEAIDDGTIDPSRVTSTWMIAKDELTCDECRSIVQLQPDGVPFGTPFTWAITTRRGSRSGQVYLAPLHPSCRCTNGYRIGPEAG